MARPGTLNETVSGVSRTEAEPRVRFQGWSLSIDRAAGMLESAKAYRSRINHKIAWACVVPPLRWFGRMDRLEREYSRANNGVRDLIRAIRDAV